MGAPVPFFPPSFPLRDAQCKQEPAANVPGAFSRSRWGRRPHARAGCTLCSPPGQWALCGQPGSEGTRGGTSWGTLWGIWDRSGGGQPCSSFPQCVLARSVPPVVTGTRGRDFNVPDGNFFVALGSKSCMLGTCGTPNLNPPPGFFPPVPPSVPARPCAPRGAAPAGCLLCPSREVSHLPNP